MYLPSSSWVGPGPGQCFAGDSVGSSSCSRGQERRRVTVRPAGRRSDSDPSPTESDRQQSGSCGPGSGRGVRSLSCARGAATASHQESRSDCRARRRRGRPETRFPARTVGSDPEVKCREHGYVDCTFPGPCTTFPLTFYTCVCSRITNSASQNDAKVTGVVLIRARKFGGHSGESFRNVFLAYSFFLNKPRLC